jgi:transglutaminase-like putative cysteine protease
MTNVSHGNVSQPVMPGLTSFLRAVVLATAAAVLCWPLTVTSGVLLAVLGALAGAVAGDLASRTRLRFSGMLAICLAVLAAGTWTARLAVKSETVARALGPVAALWISEAALWLVLVAPVVFGLRFLAARRPVLGVLEVLAVGGALIVSLAAHREGMVHRPLPIGDWAWSRGLDPVLALLVLGAFVTALLAALLISEDRRRRLPLHFGVLAALALLLLMVVRVTGVPKPDPAGELGLTGEPEDGEDQEGDAEDSGGGSSRDPSDELDDLEFRDEYGSGGQQAPVAVVLLHDDYSPPSGVYYFRQSAFSQYNGRRLVQATRDDVDRDVVPRFPARPLRVPDAPAVSDKRMDLRTSMGLLVDHVRPFALDSPAALRPTRNPDAMRFQRTFEVLSRVQTLPYPEMIGLEPGTAGWSDEQWEHYTEAPADPRYEELAERLMDFLKDEYRGDPLAQALAIKAFLDKQGIYSRRSSHAGADDPTASFLFGDLTGYCVHFAHAATYLMRTRGIPARVAAGYAIAEAARGSGSTLMVRGADAHAWPEIYLEAAGWVVIDPAPEQTLDEPAGPPDQRLQSMLGEMMRQQRPEEMDFEEARRLFNWPQIRKWLLLALLALLAAAYAVKFYRTLVPFFSRPLQRYRVAYRAALDRLAEVGLKRRFGESREDFAARTRDLAPSFDELTRRHLGWALGSAERGDAGGFSRLMIGVERELRRATPLWRWLAGMLNPFSWIKAR